MLLAIDAGNTNTVFALHDGEKLLAQWRATTQDMRTADEYIVWLAQLMQLDQLEPAHIDDAIIATVVPQALFGLQSLCRRFLRTEPMVVGDPQIDLGIDVRVDRPSDVGADRLVNSVGAHATYQGSLIVVDFGTATTFDVVNGDGAYEGGAIAPGINLSAEALHAAAARLPNVAIRKPRSVIGKGTEGAMQSGIYWGYIGLIEGLIARIEDEFGEEMTVVGTGGLAPLFEKGTAAIHTVDADLTIRGLVDIYQRNRR
ncbi:MAG: type III pantothenate kinase [Pseudomonadota bacterium]